MFSSNFNRNLEKATSQLLLEPDWDAVLQIVDCIRQGDIQPKFAVQAIKKKVSNENPHVSKFALEVLEACVKNCGSGFHAEIATKESMEFLKDLVKNRPDPVKEKVLELIQAWSHAFRNEPKLKAVEDTFHVLKVEGYKFPVLKEADAMFNAETAPEWKDAETCTRCRVQFGMMQRKHHCRNCGEVFCGKCSSKTSIIPKIGFEREVRVCDACHEKINKPTTGKKEDELPTEYLASPLSKQSQVSSVAPPAKSEREQQEEDELMLAIALSKSEHEVKEKQRERLRTNYGVYGGSAVNDRPASPKQAQQNNQPAVQSFDTSDMDPELARYLNRHYWQQKSEEKQVEQTVSTTVPSAPISATDPHVSTGHNGTVPQVTSSQAYQNGDTDDQEQFLSALQGSLEIFVNRMRSNSQRGRPIANDSAVQSLFAVISEMHPQLMKYIQEKEDTRGYYEGLQDKLTQLRDAREALDSLRDEHREKRRREAEELERQRQIQMMQKLEVMRQKKHEYLEMQRQLALQRLQEQEREMAARFEQQKQLTQIRQMQAYGYPQAQPGYGGPMMNQPGVAPNPALPPQGYAPGSTEGSPVHRLGGVQPDVYNSMPQGMMPPTSQTYMGQPMMPGGYTGGGMSIPPAGYQPDPQMMGQTFQPHPDQGPMSLPAQSGMQPQMMTTASSHMGQQPNNQTMMDGQAGQTGYNQVPQQPADFQNFNMQGLSNALPPQQNQGVYGNQPQQPAQYGQAPQQYMGQYPQNQTVQPPAPQPQQSNDVQLISFD